MRLTPLCSILLILLAALFSAPAQALNPVAARELRARALSPFPARELAAFAGTPIPAKELSFASVVKAYPARELRPVAAREWNPWQADKDAGVRNVANAAAPIAATEPDRAALPAIPDTPAKPYVERSGNPEDYDPAAY